MNWLFSKYDNYDLQRVHVVQKYFFNELLKTKFFKNTKINDYEYLTSLKWMKYFKKKFDGQNYYEFLDERIPSLLKQEGQDHGIMMNMVVFDLNHYVIDDLQSWFWFSKWLFINNMKDLSQYGTPLHMGVGFVNEKSNKVYFIHFIMINNHYTKKKISHTNISKWVNKTQTSFLKQIYNEPDIIINTEPQFLYYKYLNVAKSRWVNHAPSYHDIYDRIIIYNLVRFINEDDKESLFSLMKEYYKQNLLISKDFCEQLRLWVLKK